MEISSDVQDLEREKDQGMLDVRIVSNKYMEGWKDVDNRALILCVYCVECLETAIVMKSS